MIYDKSKIQRMGLHCNASEHRNGEVNGWMQWFVKRAKAHSRDSVTSSFREALGKIGIENLKILRQVRFRSILKDTADTEQSLTLKN